MKILFKIIIVILIFSISIGVFAIGNGYDMYKEALENKPLLQKIEEIKSNDNYTTIDKLPKIYLNAVVAVEDHRFYNHPGIDVIAIGRAFINDIKIFLATIVIVLKREGIELQDLGNLDDYREKMSDAENTK